MKYNVCRYFNGVFEQIVGTYDDEADANNTAYKLNAKPYNKNITYAVVNFIPATALGDH